MALSTETSAAVAGTVQHRDVGLRVNGVDKEGTGVDTRGTGVDTRGAGGSEEVLARECVLVLTREVLAGNGMYWF